jgi:hypothetical protein
LKDSGGPPGLSLDGYLEFHLFSASVNTSCHGLPFSLAIVAKWRLKRPPTLSVFEILL